MPGGGIRAEPRRGTPSMSLRVIFAMVGNWSVPSRREGSTGCGWGLATARPFPARSGASAGATVAGTRSYARAARSEKRAACAYRYAHWAGVKSFLSC